MASTPALGGLQHPQGTCSHRHIPTTVIQSTKACFQGGGALKENAPYGLMCLTLGPQLMALFGEAMECPEGGALLEGVQTWRRALRAHILIRVPDAQLPVHG